MRTVRPLPAGAVSITGGLLAQRREATRANGLPRLYDRLDAHGVVGNFRGAPRRGLWFSDADLHAWLEAAAWFGEGDLVRSVGRVVLGAQRPDGYLNTAFGDGERYVDLRTSQEHRCAGAFVEAAVAAHVSGVDDGALLAGATRLADHLWREFGPSGRDEVDGHPGVESALVALARATGDERHLELAALLCRRARPEAHDELVGHAVRVQNLAAGMADVCLETGDEAFAETLQRWWISLVETRSYVTGGVGGRWLGESVGRAYELPNEGAHAEACAAVATVRWAQRMLELTGDPAYGDHVERALFNAVLAGVSLHGDEWFHSTPLASAGTEEDGFDGWPRELAAELVHHGAVGRRSWFPVTCCPPNLQRLLGALPQLVAGEDDDGPWVHQYAASTVSGDGWRLLVDTDYPWDGRIAVRVVLEAPGELSLRLRVPSWARRPKVAIDGQPLGRTDQPVPGTYLVLRRRWTGRETVTIDLDVAPFLVACHPMVAENRGSVAVQRGPIVHCFEGVDHVGLDTRALAVEVGAALVAEHRPDLLGGVTTVRARGRRRTDAWGPLHRPLADAEAAARWAPVNLLGVPYFAWANRGAAPMAVWLARA